MTATASHATTIRTLDAAELGRLEACAREFYALAPSLGRFDAARFRAFWTELLELRAGVIFAALEGDEISGTIGGMIHREVYSDRLIVQEFFWFVRPDARGAGVGLYRAFEQWARERGARAIRMVHLFDSMPEKVARFYLRSGFQPLEMHYQKDLA